MMHDENIIASPQGVTAAIKEKTDRNGYPYYTALVSVSDGSWGDPLTVRCFLSTLYTKKECYRLYTDDCGHFWKLLSCTYDDEEHQTLARFPCDYELDMQDLNTRRNVAIDLIAEAMTPVC